jgi:hypothetical protein
MAEVESDNVEDYLRQLTPQTRVRLLAELERLRLCDDDIPGTNALLTELRKEFGRDSMSTDSLELAAQHLFRPLEPFLVNRSPDHAHEGRISRASLTAIWDLISRELMHSVAESYALELKKLIAAKNDKQAEQAARTFQSKAFKYLEGVLASEQGAQRTRNRLAIYTSMRSTFDDLLKMVLVLKTSDALAQFEKRLPKTITDFDDEVLAEIRAALDAFAKSNPDALPFALTLLSRHLKSPWQLIRLATKAVDSKDAAEIAATPYALAVTMALNQMDDKVAALRSRIRTRAPIAKDVLVEIYDTEYAMRVRIDLTADSPWGQRLDAIMKMVSELLQAEMQNIPASLRHVLGSSALKRHESLVGQLTRIAWKCRDALSDGVTFWRHSSTNAQDSRR